MPRIAPTVSLPWYGLYTAGLRNSTSSASVASAASWSPRTTASPNGCIERLVDELVRELVVRALHVPILDAPEPARNPARLEEELLQRRVLDAVLAAHLLDHQLRVGDDLEHGDVQLGRFAQAGDEPAVLGHVVRRRADRDALRREHRAVLRLEHVAVGGRPRVAARAAVGEQTCLHGYPA